MKNSKYFLLTTGLISLAIIPTTITLISCSKEQVDIIEHYKDAEGAKFYDENDYETIMTKEQTPFKCDFNLTQKICTIVQWIGKEPNHMIFGLPPREHLGGDLNKKIILFGCQVKFYIRKNFIKLWLFHHLKVLLIIAF